MSLLYDDDGRVRRLATQHAQTLLDGFLKRVPRGEDNPHLDALKAQAVNRVESSSRAFRALKESLQREGGGCTSDPVDKPHVPDDLSPIARVGVDLGLSFFLAVLEEGKEQENPKLAVRLLDHALRVGSTVPASVFQNASSFATECLDRVFDVVVSLCDSDVQDISSRALSLFGLFAQHMPQPRTLFHLMQVMRVRQLSPPEATVRGLKKVILDSAAFREMSEEDRTALTSTECDLVAFLQQIAHMVKEVSMKSGNSHLYECGRLDTGELGLQEVAVEVPFVQAAGGYDTKYAVNADGEVFVFADGGSEKDRGLGDVSVTDGWCRVPVISDVGAECVCPSHYEGGGAYAIGKDGKCYEWGSDDRYLHPEDLRTPTVMRHLEGRHVVQFATCGNASAALVEREDGVHSVLMWGKNCLVNGEEPEEVVEGQIGSIALSSYALFIVSPDGNRAWAKGDNEYCRLGIDRTADAYYRSSERIEALNDLGILKIVTSDTITATILKDGRVFFHGYNKQGDDGHHMMMSHTETQVPTPFQSPDLAPYHIVDMVIGSTRAVALDSAGDLHMWGLEFPLTHVEGSGATAFALHQKVPMVITGGRATVPRIPGLVDGSVESLSALRSIAEPYTADMNTAHSDFASLDEQLDYVSLLIRVACFNLATCRPSGLSHPDAMFFLTLARRLFGSDVPQLNSAAADGMDLCSHLLLRNSSQLVTFLLDRIDGRAASEPVSPAALVGEMESFIFLWRLLAKDQALAAALGIAPGYWSKDTPASSEGAVSSEDHGDAGSISGSPVIAKDDAETFVKAVLAYAAAAEEHVLLNENEDTPCRALVTDILSALLHAMLDTVMVVCETGRVAEAGFVLRLFRETLAACLASVKKTATARLSLQRDCSILFSCIYPLIRNIQIAELSFVTNTCDWLHPLCLDLIGTLRPLLTSRDDVKAEEEKAAGDLECLRAVIGPDHSDTMALLAVEFTVVHAVAANLYLYVYPPEEQQKQEAQDEAQEQEGEARRESESGSESESEAQDEGEAAPSADPSPQEDEHSERRRAEQAAELLVREAHFLRAGVRPDTLAQVEAADAEQHVIPVVTFNTLEGALEQIDPFLREVARGTPATDGGAVVDAFMAHAKQQHWHLCNSDPEEVRVCVRLYLACLLHHVGAIEAAQSWAARREEASIIDHPTLARVWKHVWFSFRSKLMHQCVQAIHLAQMDDEAEDFCASDVRARVCAPVLGRVAFILCHVLSAAQLVSEESMTTQTIPDSALTPGAAPSSSVTTPTVHSQSFYDLQVKKLRVNEGESDEGDGELKAVVEGLTRHCTSTSASSFASASPACGVSDHNEEVLASVLAAAFTEFDQSRVARLVAMQNAVVLQRIAAAETLVQVFAQEVSAVASMGVIIMFYRDRSRHYMDGVASSNADLKLRLEAAVTKVTAAQVQMLTSRLGLLGEEESTPSPLDLRYCLALLWSFARPLSPRDMATLNRQKLLEALAAPLQMDTYQYVLCHGRTHNQHNQKEDAPEDDAEEDDAEDDARPKLARELSERIVVTAYDVMRTVALRVATGGGAVAEEDRQQVSAVLCSFVASLCDLEGTKDRLLASVLRFTNDLFRAYPHASLCTKAWKDRLVAIAESGGVCERVVAIRHLTSLVAWEATEANAEYPIALLRVIPLVFRNPHVHSAAGALPAFHSPVRNVIAEVVESVRMLHEMPVYHGVVNRFIMDAISAGKKSDELIASLFVIAGVSPALGVGAFEVALTPGRAVILDARRGGASEVTVCYELVSSRVQFETPLSSFLAELEAIPPPRPFRLRSIPIEMAHIDFLLKLACKFNMESVTSDLYPKYHTAILALSALATILNHRSNVDVVCSHSKQWETLMRLMSPCSVARQLREEELQFSSSCIEQAMHMLECQLHSGQESESDTSEGEGEGEGEAKSLLREVKLLNLPKGVRDETIGEYAQATGPHWNAVVESGAETKEERVEEEMLRFWGSVEGLNRRDKKQCIDSLIRMCFVYLRTRLFVNVFKNEPSYLVPDQDRDVVSAELARTLVFITLHAKHLSLSKRELRALYRACVRACADVGRRLVITAAHGVLVKNVDMISLSSVSTHEVEYNAETGLARTDGRFESAIVYQELGYGNFYYEVDILNSDGLDQLGYILATEVSAIGGGDGVGDVSCSYGYDGSRNRVYANGSSYAAEAWEEGETIGLCLESSETECKMYHTIDGVLHPELEVIHVEPTTSMYAGVTVRDPIRINFGQRPFRYLPDGFRGVYVPPEVPQDRIQCETALEVCEHVLAVSSSAEHGLHGEEGKLIRALNAFATGTSSAARARAALALLETLGELFPQETKEFIEETGEKDGGMLSRKAADCVMVQLGKETAPYSATAAAMARVAQVVTRSTDDAMEMAGALRNYCTALNYHYAVEHSTHMSAAFDVQLAIGEATGSGERKEEEAARKDEATTQDRRHLDCALFTPEADAQALQWLESSAAVQASVIAGGEKKVLMRGNQYYSQFGEGSEYSNDRKQVATEIPSFLDKNCVEVVLGNKCTFVLDEEGGVWSCGLRKYGRTGTSSYCCSDEEEKHLHPLSFLPPVKEISVSKEGYGHGLAITADGNVWSWGDRDDGKRGNEEEGGARIPLFDELDVSKVWAASHSSMVLTQQGRVYLFGKGVDSGCEPLLQEGLSEYHITSIAGGRSHWVCTDGTRVFVLGHCSAGSLGLGDDATSSIRWRVNDQLSSLGKKWVDVQCGARFTMLLSECGEVWTMGKNYRGQCGTGDEEFYHYEPRRVKALPPVKAIRAGKSFALAVTGCGDVYGWGRNRYAQLGHESACIYSPVRVEMPQGTCAFQVAAGFDTASFLTFPKSGSVSVPRLDESVPDTCPRLQGLPVEVVQRRIALLARIRNATASSLQAFGFNSLPLSKPHFSTMMDVAARKALVDRALDRSMGDGPLECIEIVHSAVLKQSVFKQIAIVANSFSRAQLRRPSPVWKARFAGLGGDDAGGPYNESISLMCDELSEMAMVDILTRCPNHSSTLDCAQNKSRLCLNGACSVRENFEFLQFFGTLIGIAFRTRDILHLDIAPVVWKQLSGEELTVDDLRSIDLAFVRMIEYIRDVTKYGFTAETFEDVPHVKELGAAVNPSDPHGAPVPLTFETREQWCDLALLQRLHQWDPMLAVIRKGLAKVVDPALLTVLTPKELDQWICGSGVIDWGLLKEHTLYENCNEETELVGWLWEVLREMNAEEGEHFLRFVCSRSRLPHKELLQEKKMRVSVISHDGDPDLFLPSSQTCFFRLQLPLYSTKEVLSRRLRYAITECVAIDADDYARSGSFF